MPLTPLIEGYRKSVREFLDDPNSALLLVRAAPEAESVAAKVIASVEEEPSSDEVMLAHTGPFADPVSYYQAACAATLDNFSEYREALRQEGVYFVVPEGLDAEYRAPGLTAEVLFADFAERCGRALYRNVARRVVFVLRAEEPYYVAAFVRSTAFLGSLTAAERTKFIVFVRPEAAELGPLPPAGRMAVIEPDRSEALQLALLGFVSDVARRVLVIRCSAIPVDRVRYELEGLRCTLLRVSLRLGPIESMAERAISELSNHAKIRGVSPEPPDQTLDPVDRLAAFSESIAHLLSADRVCVVAMELVGSTSDELDAGRGFAMMLLNGACSPRVHYVLLDTTRTGLFPRLQEAPRRASALKVAIDPSALEGGLKAKLELPDLPVAERIQCLQGLALIASARQQHELALTLHDQALGHAEQINDPTTNYVVWLGIGHSLYRATSFEAAERAFSRALTIALDSGLTASIPEATLQLANALFCQGKLGDALTCYESAMAWYEKLAVPLFALHAQTWAAEAKRRSGDTAGAEELWSSANERYKSFGEDFADMALEGRKQVLGRLVRLHEEQRNRGQAARRKAELDALGAPPILTEQP